MRTAHLIKERQVLRLVFPLEFNLIRELNKIPYLIQKNDAWETPVEIKTVLLLEELNFVFSRSLEVWADKHIRHVEHQSKHSRGTWDESLQLYNFQMEGVKFIESKSGRALIADEMGLGKTVQALYWLRKHDEFRPVLIICPASLKLNWEREVERWIGVKAQILNGTSSTIKIKKEIVIINYDILPYWIEKLKLERFTAVIVDEAHFIKNNSAKRTKAFKRLIKEIPKIVALTGTPIENKPVEIYNIVQAINPMIFPNFIAFAQEFCNAKRNRFGWDFSGSANSKKLNAILKATIMIRRKKEDVLTELPVKNIVKVPVTIDNRQEYDKAEKEFISFLRDRFNKNIDDEVKEELKNFAKRNKINISDELTESEIKMLLQEKFQKVAAAPILSQIEMLKQLVIQGKLNQICLWIDTFLESGEKLVVFCTHRKTVDYLMEKFGRIAVKVDGSVTTVQRQKAVDKFQNDNSTRLFIGNIKAAGVGITLTAASNAAMIEFPWSPGELSQAADRIHRITQTKQVTIWNIVGDRTIEEKIIDLLRKKEHIINQVIDGKVYKDSNILSELIKSYIK
jgi:SWI/SNF-related matrix-associated actin-dependent regulator 1 of chromatin subfamily A